MPLLPLALIALAIAPFAIYLSFKRPMLFPLGLYILLLPYDTILGTTLTVTRLVAVAAGAALLLHMAATRRVLAPPKSWTGWAAFILLAALTGLWTIDTTRSSLWIGQVLQLFLLYTILAVFPADRKDVRIVGGIIVASGLLFSIIALAGYAQGVRTQEDRLTLKLSGLLIDPNHVAADLLLPIAIAVGALLEVRDFRIRLGAAVSACLMVPTLFLTGSRGGLVAVGILLLYLAWKTRYRLQILGLMALAGLGSLMLPTVWARFAEKGLAGGSGRLFIWDAGGLALRDHWLIGCGFGAFEAAYDREFLSTYQSVFQGWSRPAHDAVLSAAVEMGILGAVLLIYAWWRSWRDAQGNVVIEAALIAWFAASLFLDVILIKYLWLVFAMAALVKNAAEPRFLRGGFRKPQLTGRERIVARQRSFRARRVRPPRAEPESIAVGQLPGAIS